MWVPSAWNQMACLRALFLPNLLTCNLFHSRSSKSSSSGHSLLTSVAFHWHTTRSTGTMEFWEHNWLNCLWKQVSNSHQRLCTLRAHCSHLVSLTNSLWLLKMKLVNLNNQKSLKSRLPLSPTKSLRLRLPSSPCSRSVSSGHLLKPVVIPSLTTKCIGIMA